MLLSKHHMDKVRSYIRVNPITGCHEWTGQLDDGYGMYSITNKSGRSVQRRVHRLTMAEHVGRVLLKNEYVCHKCMNKACSNVDHLYIGDSFTNMRPGECTPTKNKWTELDREFRMEYSDWDFILYIQKKFNLPNEHEALLKIVREYKSACYSMIEF